RCCTHRDLHSFPTRRSSDLEVENVVAVAATTSDDELATRFSSFGATSVDLGAPGQDIFNTFPTYMTYAMSYYGLPTNYATISGRSEEHTLNSSHVEISYAVF